MRNIEDYLNYIRIELKPLEVEGEKHCFSMTVKVVLDVFNSNKTVEIAQDEWYSINACDYMNPNGPCTCIGYQPYGERQVLVSEQMGFVNSLFMAAREIAETIQSFFPDTDLDMLENSIQQYKDIDAWNDTPILEEEAFERLQTVMQEAGELEQKAPYNVIVNNKFSSSIMGRLL